MPELEPSHISLTDEEEAEIRCQVTEDPEDPAHWENATPFGLP